MVQDPGDGLWALNMPASQSTRFATFSNASNSVDGNYSNYLGTGSCSRTDYGDMKPWWQVDLLQMLIITSVKLYNRGDWGEYRLHDFRIDVLAHANDTDPQKCNEQTGFPMGHSFKYKCLQHLLGRIVRVRKTIVYGILDALALCEVEVYGWKLGTLY
ncbi:fucolectin-7-like [Gigantopelta aegis]|uniref:fucolectin-7-like n=1 Tax=Gigantopelta aegis TaxID=1735272 RepID=UPI001B88C96E|nr:fucolectin-7-like [Gigantopelta aegis]